MKTLITLLAVVLFSTISPAQTATNFTCNDCAGASHDLFTELDAGKVIVLAWVMPCGACAGPATTAYNTVQGFQSSHPNRVFLYLVDDYANTTCSALNSWANGLGILQNSWSLRFSNPAIDMLDYGSTGMPKIVVVGGTGHNVYYNTNNTVNQTNLQNAISAALSSTGFEETENPMQVSIFPNPASNDLHVKFTTTGPGEITISLYDLQGKLISTLLDGFRPAGKHESSFNILEHPEGSYLLKITDGTTEQSKMLNIRH